jgi:hypothetical protein
MDDHFFDDLTKRLSEGVGSRRRALVSVGRGLLAAALPSLLQREAEASAKRRCHKKHGLYLPKGNCHCTDTCTTPSGVTYTCHNNETCGCWQTIGGKGFCGLGGHAAACTTDTDCDTTTGERCVVEFNCTDTGGPCTTSADCNEPGNLCMRSWCMSTLCVAPCPP